MFLVEPERTPYDLNFSILGIPVRVHPLFWLMGVLGGARKDTDAIELLTWVGVVFVSILIHEFGHAIAMRRYGEAPRVVLYMMGGLATSDSGWSRYSGRVRQPIEQIIISLAGPVAGFLFAAIVVGLTLGFGGIVQFHLPTLQRPVFFAVGIANERMFDLVANLLFVNIFWGLMNLLPVYPLDGGQIARQYLEMKDPSRGMVTSLQISFVVGAATAAIGYLLWEQIFLAVLFGSLAYSSWQALQQFGGGRGRPW